MLGGAARGSFEVLDYDFFLEGGIGHGGEERFEIYYGLLHDMIATYHLDGLDLDVEEHFSLPGCVRLIDRLKKDFGPGFLITLAPVASAIWSRDPRANMSGFDYLALEQARGGSIAWYNCQFYNGWGTCGDPRQYFACLAAGFDSSKIVLGCLTNQRNGGSGFVDLGSLAETVLQIGDAVGEMGQSWGGVMGWELFNAGGEDADFVEWVGVIGAVMGIERAPPDEVANGSRGRGEGEKSGGVEAGKGMLGKGEGEGGSVFQPVDQEASAAKKDQEVQNVIGGQDTIVDGAGAREAPVPAEWDYRSDTEAKTVAE